MRAQAYATIACMGDPLDAARGLDVPGLLRLLAELDGAEEAAVAQSALDAGVPQIVVFDELQREVERRLLRTQGFYDEHEW